MRPLCTAYDYKSKFYRSIKLSEKTADRLDVVGRNLWHHLLVWDLQLFPLHTIHADFMLAIRSMWPFSFSVRHVIIQHHSKSWKHSL